MEELNVFKAGNGINCTKLNENFEKVRQQANSNETELTKIDSTALRKDGSNLTQDIVNDFKKDYPVTLETSGEISLDDNKAYFLTLTGNGTIKLPTVQTDQLSHTITVVVQGSEFSLDLGTTYHLVQNPSYVDLSNPYSVLYIYNKIDNKWYYCLTQ